MMRRVGLAVLVVLMSVTSLVLTAGSASAHALLESSTPAANETLQSAPSRLVLTFTEPPDPTLSSIQLIDSHGVDVRLGPPRVDDRTISLPLESSPADGTYTVTWRVVSRTDGHVTAGSFAFGIGQAPSGSAARSARQGTSPFPSALSVVAKWMLYVGLSLLLAAGVVVTLVFGIRGPPRWPVAAGAAAVVLGWAGLVLAERSAIGVSVTAFLSSSSGHPYLWLGGAAAAIVAGVVAWLATSRAEALRATAFFAAGAMLIRAIGGHADAGRFPALEVLAQFAHILAVGIWIGGVVWLLLLLTRLEPMRRPEAVRRFSTTAGFALLVVATTGVIRALDELGGPTHLGRLFHTDYGWTLTAKVATSAALVAAGAWNRYVNVPRIANGPSGATSLRRVLAAEALLAAGIFGLTGLLTGLPPAASASGGTSGGAPGPLIVTGSDFATTVRARLAISPGTVGSNTFTARVVDYDTGRPVDATRVSLIFSAVSNPGLPSSTLELRPASDGTWAGTGAGISIDDRWKIVMTVQTAGGSSQVPMEVAPRVPGGHLAVQRAPGQPTLYTTTFPDGTSIQAYVDPGSPGQNQLHATAFDGHGNELPLHAISLIAIPPDGDAMALDPQPFSAGHFAANVEITPGTWRFEIRALSHTGGVLDARFDETFGGATG
jgi:copper transport protein